MDRIYSKIILCGEHAVLRGGLALVAPYKEHFLEYCFLSNDDKFNLELDEKVLPYQILILGTFEKALEMLNCSKASLKGHLAVKSLIPMGKGLGGSASVCVLVARVMKGLKLLKSDLFDFALELEHMFHGKSSGVDIAGCLSDQAISYRIGKPPQPLMDLSLSPFDFSLHMTQKAASTEECIKQVLKIENTNVKLFLSLDKQMNEASLKMQEAFQERNSSKMKESFFKASLCFEKWGLVTQEMKELSEKLFSKGALGVKPTGSGGGGALLAVWRKL